MDYITHLDKKDPGSATTQIHPDLGFTFPIKYWDFHVYYTTETRTEAEALRNKLLHDFPDDAKTGAILVKKLPTDTAVGPHYFPFWEVDVARVDVFSRVISWFLLYHGNLSVLIHPQTGDNLGDHTTRALWLGDRLDLKLQVFDPAQKGIPEFGVKHGKLIPAEEFDSWKTVVPE